jgi:hypothetical protein
MATVVWLHYYVKNRLARFCCQMALRTATKKIDVRVRHVPRWSQSAALSRRPPTISTACHCQVVIVWPGQDGISLSGDVTWRKSKGEWELGVRVAGKTICQSYIIVLSNFHVDVALDSGSSLLKNPGSVLLPVAPLSPGPQWFHFWRNASPSSSWEWVHGSSQCCPYLFLEGGVNWNIVRQWMTWHGY